MAEIKTYPLFRHLRAESSSQVLRFRKGQLVQSGPGLSFWFHPLSTSLAEIPLDDRELSFLFHGRSADHQEITTQGVVTYRVVDPELLAQRIDFTVDLSTGQYIQQPFEKLSLLVTQLAQQFAWEYLAATGVRELLREGVGQLRARIAEGLGEDPGLRELGIEIASVRVSAVSPTTELEKALQTPTREALQQEADEATFRRRAHAVEKERAIQENELTNRIELARREEQLIERQGQNQRRKATEEMEAQKIETSGEAERRRIKASSRAEAIRLVEESKLGAEKERMTIYADMPAHNLLALGVRELAGKLQRLEHVHLSPDLLGPLMADLVRAGTRKLENGGGTSVKEMEETATREVPRKDLDPDSR